MYLLGGPRTISVVGMAEWDDLSALLERGPGVILSPRINIYVVYEWSVAAHLGIAGSEAPVCAPLGRQGMRTNMNIYIFPTYIYAQHIEVDSHHLPITGF